MIFSSDGKPVCNKWNRSPAELDLEDYVYFTWDFSEPNWEFSDDTWSDIDDIIQEISCNFMIDDVNFYYHSVLVAGKQNAIMSVAFVYALVDF